jgi:hypothetical protein
MIDVWAELHGVPEYQCCKLVRAAKITAMRWDTDEHSDTLVHLDCGAVWGASQEWVRKHIPRVGGYLVFYADGYVSYSPPETFENGYARVEVHT